MLLEICSGVVIAGLVYCLVKYCLHIIHLKDYPPGPWPLPVVGNLHLISHKPHKALMELAKRHGPVMGFSFGSQRMVVVQSIKDAKEMLITKAEDFAGILMLGYFHPVEFR